MDGAACNGIRIISPCTSIFSTNQRTIVSHNFFQPNVRVHIRTQCYFYSLICVPGAVLPSADDDKAQGLACEKFYTSWSFVAGYVYAKVTLCPSTTFFYRWFCFPPNLIHRIIVHSCTPFHLYIYIFVHGKRCKQTQDNHNRCRVVFFEESKKPLRDTKNREIISQNHIS